MGRKLIKVTKSSAVVIEPFTNEYGKWIGIREFYKPRDNEESDWLPSRNGLSIPVKGDEEDAKDFAKKVGKAILWAQDNFEEEHKVLERRKDGKQDEVKKKSKKGK